MLGLPQLVIRILTDNPEGQSNLLYKYINALRLAFRLLPRNDIEKRHAKKDLPPALLDRCKYAELVHHASLACPSHKHRPDFISFTS